MFEIKKYSDTSATKSHCLTLFICSISEEKTLYNGSYDCWKLNNLLGVVGIGQLNLLSENSRYLHLLLKKKIFNSYIISGKLVEDKFG